jgi:hypothetical protein
LLMTMMADNSWPGDVAVVEWTVCD